MSVRLRAVAGFLPLGLLPLGLLVACGSTDQPDASADGGGATDAGGGSAFPVTVPHKYGGASASA